MPIKTKIVSCHTADSKPVKQEVNGTLILLPLVFPGRVFNTKYGRAFAPCTSFRRTVQPNLKWKTRPKQPFSSLPLAFALPILPDPKAPTMTSAIENLLDVGCSGT
jgi:hypothetical protein